MKRLSLCRVVALFTPRTSSHGVCLYTKINVLYGRMPIPRGITCITLASKGYSSSDNAVAWVLAHVSNYYTIPHKLWLLIQPDASVISLFMVIITSAS